MSRALRGQPKSTPRTQSESQSVIGNFASAALVLFGCPTVMKLSKQKIMKAIVLTLLLLAGATVFASRSQQQEPREARDKVILPENYLPEGEARDVIFQACVQCHDLRNTVSQRKTAAAWKRTVDEMIWRGAPLTAVEAETIAKYLAASFGPDKPIPEELQLKKKSTSDKR